MAQFTHSIVIPAYNESSRLGASLEKILAYVQKSGWRAEILIVNDGSRDNTAEIARSFERRYGLIRLIENPGNRGKGFSVRNGMLHASGDRLLLQTPIFRPLSRSPRSCLRRSMQGPRLRWDRGGFVARCRPNVSR